MRSIPHTVVRWGRYSFQIAIPADVRAHFGGKALVQIPLHTDDPDQAIVAVGRLRSEWKARIQAARRGADAQVANGELAMVGDNFRQVLAGEAIENALRRIRDDVTASADWLESSYHTTIEFLTFAGIALTADQQEQLDAAVGGLTRRNILSSSAISRIAVPEPEPADTPRPVLVPPADGNPNGLIGLHAKFRAAHPVGSTTMNNDLDSFRRFKEMHGDISVNDITERHLRDFRDGLTNNKTTGEPLNKQTIQKLLSPIKALLSWAADEGLVESNVGAAVKVHGVGQDVNKRRPFLPEHLTTIFTSGPFAPGAKDKGSEEYWMMLLALFTGARLGEAVQLHAEDIREVPLHKSGKAWVMRIHTEDGKSTKTEESERVIPIHPQLFDLGFVTWAKSRTGLLFPDLQTGERKTKQVSDVASKRLNRMIDAAGIKDGARVVHSFRHNMEDACRDAGHEERLADAIQGHKSTTTSGGYGHGFSTKALVEAMAELHWPVDLSHLIPKTTP